MTDHIKIQGRLPVTDGRLLDFTDDPVACMRKLHQQHGSLAALQEEAQRIVFVFGPQWNQRVLSDAKTFHSRFFAVRGPKRSSQRRLTSGLLSMNGEQHKAQRRMIMEPFQKKTLLNYHESITSITNDMLNNWQTGEIRDMNQEMVDFQLRVTSAILFGVDEPEFACQIGRMIDRWVHMNHLTGMGAFLADKIFSERYDQLLSLAEELEQDVREMIQLRRASQSNGRDVLSLLIQAQADTGVITEDELVGHVTLLFGAAHLTTAHTFAWTLFLLAQHPSIMRPLFEEISSEISGQIPESKEINNLSLTERVIKESMRILPASSYSQRINVEPVELGPLRLAAGTPVIFSQFITHHMPQLYPEPENFQPDRWLEIAPSAYSYLPFGAGPRMCIGAPLAMMELKTALPMILKRFRLTVEPGAEISSKVISTMLGPTTTVPMLISPPDGQFAAQPVSGNIHTLVNLHEAPASGAFKQAA